jgi:hypothetical protein
MYILLAMGINIPSHASPAQKPARTSLAKCTPRYILLMPIENTKSDRKTIITYFQWLLKFEYIM